MSVTHKKVVTLANDPTKEVSKDAWNDTHAISGIVLTAPPSGKKKITNLYWDNATNEIVIEHE